MDARHEVLGGDRCLRDKRHTIMLDLKHDALFCRDCDEWRELTCAIPTCRYCPTRPEKPSMVSHD